MTNTSMTSSFLGNARRVALVAAMALACSASFAEKPDWAGGGKGGHGGDKHEQKNASHGSGSGEHGKKDKKGDHDTQRSEHGKQAKDSGRSPQAGTVRVGGYFGDQQRVVVTNYYGEQFKAGRCPPGLAKKNNGCMPPGQAKKYTVGQRLPSNVIYYEVPQTVVYQLGAPPSGHRYVRVASDILLLAIGTGMVVDAIENLSSY